MIQYTGATNLGVFFLGGLLAPIILCFREKKRLAGSFTGEANFQSREKFLQRKAKQASWIL